MRIGDLGCPGANAVLRAFARKGIHVHGWEISGIQDGGAGLRENRSVPIGSPEIGEIRHRPFLSSSRGPVKPGDSLHNLVVLGSADALAGAAKLAADALDRCRTTAESHERALVVEVAGQDSGWLALHAGLAGGADVILGPEHPCGLDRVLPRVTRRFDRGRAPIIVVSEGALPDGIPVPNGVATWLSEEISRRARKADGRPRPTGNWASGSACARSTRCTPASPASWSRCAAPMSSPSRWPRQPCAKRSLPSATAKSTLCSADEAG
ncbi:6-phosphofructokinase [Amycolatopsis rubida]|uniref:6-phosphofructokinase 1 n=1 Tax=Amycolatopsis rubida TaxID=112413 RepID=A0A1I5YU75_9PSEU|nr:6-phosphofructokinase [Amycolatopsis rubida]SFQ47732.1 6-phosphofructokinase 1 [Amycolatopsis rubida]